MIKQFLLITGQLSPSYQTSLLYHGITTVRSCKGTYTTQNQPKALFIRRTTQKQKLWRQLKKKKSAKHLREILKRIYM